ncbi:hypothetical protein Hdeb2414_s0058g00759581 [Helianthus debilis subsp. tardiflorus]
MADGDDDGTTTGGGGDAMVVVFGDWNGVGGGIPWLSLNAISRTFMERNLSRMGLSLS